MTSILEERTESPLEVFRSSLSMAQDQNSIVKQYLLMDSQNLLLEEIRDEIIKKRSPFENCSVSEVGHLEFSCQSIISSKVLSDDGSTCGGSKSKFAEEFQDSLIDSALMQVQLKCSPDVYETIRKACENHKKAMDFHALQKNLERARKEIQELTHNNMTLHKDKSNILWELNLLKPKVQKLQEEKLKIKKQLDHLSKKEAMLSQIETSLTLKEKMIGEARKRYSRQQQSALAAKSKFDASSQEFWAIWERISKKCESVSCPEQCWKKEVMKKCKDKLLEFREALKSEEQQIEKEEETMEKLSKQFKLLVQNSESLSRSTTS